MANVVSNIGIPSVIIGINTASAAADYIVAFIETKDNVKPKNSDPVSPIKIFAGLKLNGKKPSIAPIKAIRIKVKK